MVNHLNFFKPWRPKLCQIRQTRYQSTPLYLYIQNIKLVCQSDTLCTGLEWENLVYTQPNTESMVDHLSFFKPRRPKLCQIGQTRYQSTPIYLYIQNIKSVCIVQWYMTFRLHCADIIFKVHLHCICLKYWTDLRWYRCGCWLTPLQYHNNLQSSLMSWALQKIKLEPKWGVDEHLTLVFGNTHT